ncbi:UAA transporter family [Fragilaria crotonensis]|nr:UAA transporter family [Fragilaria crotonensis]
MSRPTVKRKPGTETRPPTMSNPSVSAPMNDEDMESQMQPLVPSIETKDSDKVEMELDSRQMGTSFWELMVIKACPNNPQFWFSAFKFCICFGGLQVSYLTWGYMQELIMTTKFTPTPSSPTGEFPSAAFCVFSNRFLAVIVAMICVKLKHGSVFGNNVAPLLAFTPCAISNTTSSWSQYASLAYVSFPVQTVFKSSKIIPVMLMGKLLKGTVYPWNQYFEAFLITVGVAVFSAASKSSDSDTSTEIKGLLLMVCYVCSDSFTSQWQSRLYKNYGKANIDQYQMMLGVNTSAIIITTLGLIATGDFLKVHEFLLVNPQVLVYNIITAITSATGQLFIFYTIKEFGPIVFTIIMTTRQLFSITISAVLFKHHLGLLSFVGATLVFGVLFYQIQKSYFKAAEKRNSASGNGKTAGGSGD